MKVINSPEQNGHLYREVSRVGFAVSCPSKQALNNSRLITSVSPFDNWRETNVTLCRRSLLSAKSTTPRHGKYHRMNYAGAVDTATFWALTCPDSCYTYPSVLSIWIYSDIQLYKSFNLIFSLIQAYLYFLKTSHYWNKMLPNAVFSWWSFSFFSCTK